MTLEPEILSQQEPGWCRKRFHATEVLHAGDEVVITVKGIGTLRNVVK